jgi:peptide/nickel transport system permease protein
MLAFLVATAVLAPVLSPYDPVAQNISNALAPPSTSHWFGTDEFGRDVLARVLYGTRPALLVGVLSVLVSVCVGVPLGMLAGYFGGWIDRIVSGWVDVMLSFPALLLALLIVTLLGSGVPVLILALGIAHVPIFVRLARSSSLLVRELDYVAASRSFGASRLHVIAVHVLPNVLGPVVVMASLGIAGAIREEAALSFLGLGIQPPQPSWGNLIREGIAVIFDAPWLAIIPGLYLTASVLAFNLLGDVARDALDPRDVSDAATQRRTQP